MLSADFYTLQNLEYYLVFWSFIHTYEHVVPWGWGSRDGPQKQVSVGKGNGSATAAENQEVLKVMNALEISCQKENSWIF